MARRMIAVAALLLAGCAAEAPAPVVREGPGPLERIIVGGGLGDDTAEVIAELRSQEEAIAACMHEAGFAYAPQVPQADQVVFHPDDAAALDPVEFAERYGYGLWYPPDNGGGIEYSMTEDPDQAAYLAAMSRTEAEAYETALWGPVIEEGDDGSITRGGGCRDAAHGPRVADAAEQAFLDGIATEAWEFLGALSEDPAFDDLNREWSDCLREAGHRAASPEDAQQQVYETFDTALRAAGHQVTAAMKAEHGPAEIALATADAECRVQVDHEARAAAIRWDLEQEYVDAHAADLEAYQRALAALPDRSD